MELLNLMREAAANALTMCAGTLIPALFPFFVAGNLLNACGAFEYAGRLLDKPSRTVFGIGGSFATAFLMGACCGYPNGAKTVRECYDRGVCTRGEAETMLCFCNNCGAAYLISGVGASLTGSAAFGIKLWLCQLASAAAVGLVLRPGRTEEQRIIEINTSEKNASLPKAISDAALTMLTVCGSAVFFAVIAGAASPVLKRLPGALSCLTLSIIDLTSGVSAAASQTGSVYSAVLPFAVCWGGLAVHAQTAAVIAPSLKLTKKYYFAKMLSALICVVLFNIGL